MRIARPLSWMLGAMVSITGCGGGGTTEPATVAAVNIDANPATLRPGQSSQFTAAAVDASGRSVSGAGSATWTSSATTVATVDGNGMVNALTEGTTTIQATIKGVSGSRTITVLPVGVGAVVLMPGFAFAPTSVTIKRTESVYFDFPSLPHNVTFRSRNGTPQNIDQQSNVTVSRQFNTSGTFPYDCTIHPGMTGEVIVQ